jgi:plasmid stabilization system protein ParE
VSLEVVWTLAAEVDAQNAFVRLDEASPEAALRFVATTDRVLELLRIFPHLAAVWQPPVRRISIRRSHYGLFYVVEPLRVVIIGVQDLRRDPERLRNELLGRLP